jgi:hypothetical protein
MRRSHGRPRGHGPIVRPSENVRVTTMESALFGKCYVFFWLVCNFFQINNTKVNKYFNIQIYKSCCILKLTHIKK